jgi:NAD-dependent SIR2 family protein deacetylase
MDGKTVVFLGAGASAADGAPVQSDLLQKFFLLRRRYDFDPISFNSEWDQELATFFLDFFGINVDEEEIVRVSRFPTFEEILGVIEIAKAQGEAFRDWSSYSIVSGNDRLQRIHDLLVYSIAEILDDTLAGKAVEHPRLVEKLKAREALQNTTFVSLNYDILIDNALLAQYPDIHLDYGISFANFEGQSAEMNGWHSTLPYKSIALFKLHGSLNWLYCPACRAIELTPMEKRIAKYRTAPGSCVCRNCDGPSVPVIIPPTFFKAFGNLYLREVWHKAERAVADADRIIFCGYSFPDADVHVRYLLKKAEKYEPKARQIFIVNEHEDKADAARGGEWDRYVRFFHDKHAIHWTRLGFQDFAEDPVSVVDPANWNTSMLVGR